MVSQTVKTNHSYSCLKNDPGWTELETSIFYTAIRWEQQQGKLSSSEITCLIEEGCSSGGGMNLEEFMSLLFHCLPG